MGGEGLFVPFDNCYVVLEEIYGEPSLSLSRQLAAMKKTKTTTSLATYLAPGTNNKAIRVIFRKNDISKKCDYERLRSGEKERMEEEGGCGIGRLAEWEGSHSLE